MSKPRILIVNCFSDNQRRARGNAWFAPQSMVTGVLAGQLHRDKVEIRAVCEFRDGPFEDLAALAWADLLVLTGLNPAFDRMKQVAAYARAVRPGIAVAAGGPVVRMLPSLSRRYFDYVCTGDVEQIAGVAHDVFGTDLRADLAVPRYDLMRWKGPVGYAESSRNCNFRCSFCSMSAEDRPYTAYNPDDLRRQVHALGYKPCVMLLDQNFFGGSREHFYARLAVLRELFEAGKMGGWAALVTADFFKNAHHLTLAKQAGCIGFFSGVESFSTAQIDAFRKKQNLVLPQAEMIESTLQAGLVFHYGLVIDLFERRIADVDEELYMILSNPGITLPSFLSLAIPLLGTPMFRERLAQGALLPNLKLRDMDGRSVMTRTLDDHDCAVAWAARMDHGCLSKFGLMRHGASFFRRYRKTLPPWGMVSALSGAVGLAWPRLGTNGRDGFSAQRGGRSYDGSAEPLGSLYQPCMNLPSTLQHYFEPVQITDSEGALAEAVRPDLTPVASVGMPTPAPRFLPEPRVSSPLHSTTRMVVEL
jgi:hypothetical protein